jgi:hypothetical protein
MKGKFSKFLFGLLFLNICWAGRPCVPENRSIALTPDTMNDQCCPGLVLKKPERGTLGTIGTCIKKNCLEAGQSIGIYPGALSCCEGLDILPPKPGIVGTGGTCVEKKCVGEGKSIALTPDTRYDKCCPGLVLKKPEEGVLGTIGTCIKKSCLEAGQSIVIYPGALKCCEGLEVQPPEPGIMGSAGTCVNYRIPSPQNVNDSRINMKEGNLKIAPDSEIKPTQVNPQ